MTNEFKKDMCELAKLVFDLSKKHGDIYLLASTTAKAVHSSVTFELNEEIYESVQYWSKENSYTKDITEVINYDTL
jgi:hypothetical protein